MRFTLTEGQQAVRQEARSFVRDHVEPVAADLDEEGAYPGDILAELGDRGLTGLTLPERYGGRDEGLVELALVVEELSAGLMAVASAVALNLGVATVIERFGTDAQRERYLPGMASFDTVGALGLSEADAGSDKTGLETTADRDGDGWILDGHKQWVTNFLNADVVLTYARTTDGSGESGDAGASGITAFLVPADEFEVDHVWDTHGARSVKSPRVTLSDVAVPDEAVVGEVGRALEQRGEVSTGVNVPARAVGLARAALEDAVEYTSGREQYGHPIGDFQGVEWAVGEMATRVETARLLTLRAADLADRGRDTTRAFAMAKVRATEVAVETANDAVQLHGGVGYTRDRDVERYLRDARLLTIAGGPNEGHRDALGAATYADYAGD